ncbi:MAG TPA: HAD-IA family hydrolase [Acidimicrobiia bacterium]
MDERARPAAVLLDVGGIFHLPDHDVVAGACERAGAALDRERVDIDLAHYTATTAFRTDYTGEMPWEAYWNAYIDIYATTLGVDTDHDFRADVVEHLHSEFSTAAIWKRIIPGSVDGLRALVATGVRVGVISNADGFVAQRLREQEVLQVGPGIGVDVECIIDSGEVGVSKPDPRIFHIALDAIGLTAAQCWYVGDMPGIDVVGARAAGMSVLVMDPFGVHPADSGFDTVASLHDIAKLVDAPAG